MENPDDIPESVVIKDTFGSSYKQSQEKFTPSPSPSPSSIVNFSGLALLLIRRTYLEDSWMEVAELEVSGLENIILWMAPTCGKTPLV